MKYWQEVQVQDINIESIKSNSCYEMVIWNEH